LVILIRKEIKMKKIEVIKPKQEELNNLKVTNWPIWEKEPSKFPWHYDQKETCYLLEGKVKVKTGDGQTVEFGKGDLVTFPEGLDCTWEIDKKVKKHYRFG
jgi:uncharacterized cupin superfamily protein